jgi:cell division protein FtsL
MKYKKFMVTAAIVALLLAIAYIALYYKSNTREQELTSKRNAILDYIKKINETSSNKTFITVNVRSQIRRSSQRM